MQYFNKFLNAAGFFLQLFSSCQQKNHCHSFKNCVAVGNQAQRQLYFAKLSALFITRKPKAVCPVASGAILNAMIYTVSKLNQEIKHQLETGFSLIQLEGEVSNFMAAASGHWYFALKDAQSQIRCVMFKFKNQYLSADLKREFKNGAQLVVRAKIGVYEPRGEYQLIVETARSKGEGDLQAKFLAIKDQLYREGLFKPEHKRALPNIGGAGLKTLGIITSLKAAALSDVLSVLKNRFPLTKIILYPSQVQGKDAPSELINAIESANEHQQCQVLLITRGGGSMEDLWCFNDEQLARAIWRSKITTVSAIGHEIDATIADLVADVSAVTPSAAAVMLSPSRANLHNLLSMQQQLLAKSVAAALERQRRALQALKHRLQQAHPQTKLQFKAQRSDEFNFKLKQLFLQQLGAHRHRLAQLRLQLLAQAPKTQILQQQRHSHSQMALLEQNYRQLWAQKQRRLQLLAQALHNLSPLATLGRGYAIVSDWQSKQTINKAAQTKVKQRLEITFSDAKIEVEVK